MIAGWRIVGRDVCKPDYDGSILWNRIEHVPVMGQLVALKRNKGTASPYSCTICNCGLSFSYLYVTPSSMNLAPVLFAPAMSTGVYVHPCSGLIYYYDITTSASWWSTYPSIATVNNSTYKGRVTGVSAGTTQYTAGQTDDVVEVDCSYPTCCYSPYTSQGSGTANVTALTCGPSSSGGQGPVLRGATAYCKLSNVPSGATTSNWQFTDGTNLVTPASNPGTTWSGVAVKTGVVSVTVTPSGGTPTSVNAPLAVSARTGWAFSAVSPVKVPNGSALKGDDPTITTLASPPVSNPDNEAVLAKYGVTIAFSYTDTTVSSGPNTGYKYITSVTSSYQGIPTTFKWLRVPDLDNASSTFYQAQCGRNGFISGSNLDVQTTRHESGTNASHRANYVTSQNNSSNNIGGTAEAQIGSPSISQGTFENQVNSLLNGKKTTIINDTASEQIAGVNYDAQGQFLGNVNYQPYASCQ